MCSLLRAPGIDVPAFPSIVKNGTTRDGRCGKRMTLLTTERLLWHPGAHTAEPNIGDISPITPIPYTKICCFLRYVGCSARGAASRGSSLGHTRTGTRQSSCRLRSLPRVKRGEQATGAGEGRWRTRPLPFSARQKCRKRNKNPSQSDCSLAAVFKKDSNTPCNGRGRKRHA